MKVDLKNILIGIGILILAFFIGRWTTPKETKIITVTVPELSGSSPIIINPKPIVTTKDSLIYEDSIIYTENPFNKELVEKYNKLKSEKDKLVAYLNSIQIRNYKVPFENDTIKIVGNIEVQGELKSVNYDWFVKERDLKLPIEITKPKMNLLLGGSVSNTIDLTKFNLNLNVGVQRKNGDIILGSYGVFDRSFQAGYLINLKL